MYLQSPSWEANNAHIWGLWATNLDLLVSSRSVKDPVWKIQVDSDWEQQPNNQGWPLASIYMCTQVHIFHLPTETQKPSHTNTHRETKKSLTSEQNPCINFLIISQWLENIPFYEQNLNWLIQFLNF